MILDTLNTFDEKHTDILTQDNIEKIKRIFKDEEEYLSTMRNLWATRKGLYSILLERPDLKNTIAPQFNTLNNLIDALLNFDLEHPIYG